MLTPAQIDALRDRFEAMADPVNEYLIKDLVRRIMEAGGGTRTAYYKAKIALMLGVSYKDVTDYIDVLYASKTAEFREAFKKTAETAWNADTGAVAVMLPFENNAALQQIVSTAVMLADDEFKNITQTLGMVDPWGNVMPLHDAYISCVDFAYNKVITGAQDWQSATREATKNLAAYGLRVIDYESGTHTELGAAIRRDIMGGLGLMVEKVEQEAAAAIGTDGWEISAHENSAEDHEPYQGRQYTNAEYEHLNGTAEHPGILKRRISTLNCKHIAFPVMLGIQKPQYTEEELQAMKERNHKGITFDGRHYTGYEATQEQRRLERAIRAQRRKIIQLEEIGDEKDLKTAQIKYAQLNAKYKEFSKAAGLKTWDDRKEVLEWGPKQEKVAFNVAEDNYQEWSKSIGSNTAIPTLDEYYEIKYNNPPKYELLKGYIKGIDKDELSPLVSFKYFEQVDANIVNNLYGITTAEGVLIKEHGAHFTCRVIGHTKLTYEYLPVPQVAEERKGVSIESIAQALTNPERIKYTVRNGERRCEYYGEHARVTIGVDKGRLIQVNP